MTKFLTMMSKEEIKLAPGQKVIKKEDFATLLDSSALLERLREDTEKYKRKIATECEKERDEAQYEGYRIGMESWTVHVADLEGEIEKLRGEMEKMILPVAIEAAKKIVNRELETSDETIVDIIANTVRSISSHHKVVIYVNKKDVEKLRNKKQRVKAVFDRLESLAIQERDDIQPGGCVIETEKGIINAQLSHQWERLESAFQQLLKKKKK